MRGDGARLGHNLTTLDVRTVDAAEQQTGVVASLAGVHGLVERLDGGNGGGLGRADADDLDRGVDGQLATLNTTGDDGTTAGDGEDVLDRHQERLVQVVNRGRDVLVDGIHQVLDGLDPLVVVRSVIVQSAVGGGTDDRAVAVEAVLVEEVTDLFLNELDELLVLDHVALVQGDEDTRDTHLTGEQNVLASLGHRAVGGSHNEDGAIHLGSTGDHVLHEVGVARAVHVSVVTLRGLVLDVGDVDGDTTLLLFGSGVDLVEVVLRVQIRVLFVQHLGDGRGQGRLTVIDVADGTNVNVRLSTLVLFLCHVIVLLDVSCSWLALAAQDTRYIVLGFWVSCHFGARTQSAVYDFTADWRHLRLQNSCACHSPRWALMISSETDFGTSA